MHEAFSIERYAAPKSLILLHTWNKAFRVVAQEEAFITNNLNYYQQPESDVRVTTLLSMIMRYTVFKL